MNEIEFKTKLDEKYANYLYIVDELFANPLYSANLTDDVTILNLIGLFHQNVLKQSGIDYYKKAFELGDVEAMYKVGLYYEVDEIDMDKAIVYYEMAATKGCVKSMANIGCCYQDIDCYEQAKTYYEMAINHGDVDSMYNLALYYEEVEKNYTQAVYYYEMASINGDMDATLKLGMYYATIDICYEKAISYFIKCDSYKRLNWIAKKCAVLLYNTLIAMPPYNVRDKVLLKLSRNKHVITYQNKIRLFTDLPKSCPICLEDNKLIINLYCGHPICVDCYPHCTKCYYKCM